MNGRKKGIKWELYIIHLLKSIGYTKAISTRNSSRYLDALKIDVNHVPFWIQIKSGRQYVSPIPLLQEIEKNVKNENLTDYPIILIRIYDREKGNNKRLSTDSLVYIMENNFNKHFKWTFTSINIVNNKINSNYREILKKNQVVLRKVENPLLVFTLDTFIEIIKANEYENR